jgi:hypothetical protein
MRTRDKEVGVDEGASAETAPDEEDGGSEVALVAIDHVRGAAQRSESQTRATGAVHDGDAKARVSKDSRLVERTNIVFHSQLEAVDRATPRERICDDASVWHRRHRWQVSR